MTDFDADRLELDRESNGGRWRLTFVPADSGPALRLRITTGGRHDWHSFVAEVEKIRQATGDRRTVRHRAVEMFLPNAPRILREIPDR